MQTLAALSERRPPRLFNAIMAGQKRLNIIHFVAFVSVEIYITSFYYRRVASIYWSRHHRKGQRMNERNPTVAPRVVEWLSTRLKRHGSNPIRIRIHGPAMNARDTI